jgi:hypothetical protein
MRKATAMNIKPNPKFRRFPKVARATHPKLAFPFRHRSMAEVMAEEDEIRKVLCNRESRGSFLQPCWQYDPEAYRAGECSVECRARAIDRVASRFGRRRP